MRDEVADGWKISQVEVLVGLSRPAFNVRAMKVQAGSAS